MARSKKRKAMAEASDDSLYLPTEMPDVDPHPEVWVNPDLERLLKGPDHKLATSEAERYWMERLRRQPLK